MEINTTHPKKALFGKTPNELKLICSELGLPAFTARQMSDWLYKLQVTSIEEMTNISKQNREKLAENYEVGRVMHSNVQTSLDGTKKYLFPTSNKRFIEAAYIPDEDRATLCVSSQVGCKMGCLFCMTGKQGFQSQLTAGEIVNQISSLPERDKLTNIVYMGMGEPFDNLEGVMKSLEILTSDWGLGMGARRITVSTIGMIPAMKHFIENSECHLAVSMHTPFHEERKKLMPIENVYPIAQVIELLRDYDFGKQRRISFEYIMFKGINDTPSHVKEIARLLNGLRCRMNLIRFHPIPDTPLQSSDEATIQAFKEALIKKGIRTTVRASRGQDIFAACGLLSTKELVKQQAPDF
ncbi:MAG: 23S rRNA (adenine(2503)-C(2))-methyltransferase RlmN [Bacteroidales bacterium]|nr:23S rRNA (adenine(2503)-C(2))-methyltransferase RlmN [Bacteroidales bacterium]HOI31420.1 23S rRNA (adenine(2503)-C(2))-methyltransferase RlmN [Bacteroidales bacterium]